MIETHKFLTYKEICEVINQLEDYRDRVLIMLIFDGFYTRMEEIQNLKMEDIMNKTKARFLDGNRISEVTFEVINKANKETTVHTYSQFSDGMENLISSNYILRERESYSPRSNEGSFNGYAMNKQAIVNRFGRLKRRFGFKFNLSSLYASGVIHRAKESIDMESKKARVLFLKRLKEIEGVNEGMGYVYYRHYLDMLPRLQAEKEEASE